MAAADSGALPNLVVIGVQKCGTSALHYYLGLHPEVQVSTPKELFFFTDESDLRPEPYVNEPRELVLMSGQRNWSRGLDWYRSHFDPGAPVRSEATPTYTSPWFPSVPERMAQVLPDAKLIFMAREPVDRMVSHYIQMVGMGREWRPLAEAVGTDENVYIARSRYASLLRPFLERFPAEQILTLRQDELLHRRRETMRRVFAFLGVREDFWDPRMERERHPSDAKGRRYSLLTRLQGARLARPLYKLPQEVKWNLERLAYRRSREPKPELDPELRARLRERLDPEMEELERITGWDLSGWRGGVRATPKRTRPRSRPGRRSQGPRA